MQIYTKLEITEMRLNVDAFEVMVSKMEKSSDLNSCILEKDVFALFNRVW